MEPAGFPHTALSTATWDVPSGCTGSRRVNPTSSCWVLALPGVWCWHCQGFGAGSPREPVPHGGVKAGLRGFLGGGGVGRHSQLTNPGPRLSSWLVPAHGVYAKLELFAVCFKGQSVTSAKGRTPRPSSRRELMNILPHSGKSSGPRGPVLWS